MIIQGNYSGLFWNMLVGTQRGRGCVIILTENTIISQFNTDGYDV